MPEDYYQQIPLPLVFLIWLGLSFLADHLGLFDDRSGPD